MDSKQKIRIVLAVASLAALSVVLYHRRSRKQRNQNRTECPQSSCYLHLDQKPQLAFKRVLADNSFSQFKHLKKLNDSQNESESSSHPYEAEIAALMESPGIELEFEEDGSVLDCCCCVWVETEAQLKELAAVLSKEKIFAVDTEQHSLRSFLGFTALVQVSTAKQDYLVDAIALHDVMGILGPVFADPSICKVFHGADNDILWLQRDFHIYVVNLFDTAKACEVLSKPQKSLAYLLETYCGVATNKLLQREDWRQRPLSTEMIQYAQTDAHYLQYIAARLIDELKQQDNNNSTRPDNKSNSFLEASCWSNMICLQMYTKEIEVYPGESAASSIFSRHLNGQGGSSISCEMQDLVRLLCTWRDFMARVHDESLRYVLSDHAIVSLVEKIPTTSTEVFDCITQDDLNVDPGVSSPLPSPSPVVCSHLDDILYLIQDKINNLDDFFSTILQNCLGPNGSCPLSVYNYGLLINCDIKLTNRLISKQNGLKNPKRVARKAARELFVQKFSCKSPVYHNCRIYASDGRLLCYCDRRKLEWYLRRDLAKLVEDDPPAIMLLFEPKGRPEDEDNDFYIQSKRNICVGCGEGSHYLRYRIIPSCYRMHFPEHLKSHRSHDIVLLCVDCHEVAHAAAEKHKKQIASEFGIPLFIRKVVDFKETPIIPETPSSEMNVEGPGVSPLQLRTAAMALLRHGQRMPPKRREELIQTVMQYYGGREISEEDLQRALLVGMSPQERRRFEKKKGLSAKDSTGSVLPDKEQANDTVSMPNSAGKIMSKLDSIDGLQATNAQQTGRVEDLDCFMATDTKKGPCSDQQIDKTVSTNAYKNMNSDENGISDTEVIHFGDADNCGISAPNETNYSCYSRIEGSEPPQQNSKISLLGHGPHGKQVVDHIIEEFGDDGIRQFCQRWRQVFVEAVHPRFLPAGWNVMHSGRRDFGEFSVYNPAKKGSTAKS